MSQVQKRSYYEDRRIGRSLAAHYYRRFEGSRIILDVGCGTGEFGRYKPSSLLQVHGVDIDAGAVARAEQFENAVCLDLESEPLPYPDATFDAILARDIFEHVQDPGRLAQEVYRVLRPGGIIIASVVMARPHRVWADYTHVRGFTRRSARMLLQDVGFTVEHIWRMGPVPLSNRLNLMSYVPVLLKVPIFDHLWSSSWELQARRAPEFAQFGEADERVTEQGSLYSNRSKVPERTARSAPRS